MIAGAEMLERYPPTELLADYPLKPHELLRDRSDRVFAELAKIARRNPEEPAWLIEQNSIEPIVMMLKDLADKDRKGRIEGASVILPPNVGGLSNGKLDGTSHDAHDVADEWYMDTERKEHRRRRAWSDAPTPESVKSMRLVREIDTQPMGIEDRQEVDEIETEEGIKSENDESSQEKRFWRWYVRPKSADDDGSRFSRQAVLLETHTNDVLAWAKRLVRPLPLADALKEAVLVAAEFHDIGKSREKWQRSIGNPDPTNWLAKSGPGMKPLERIVYRHELGSLLDLQGTDRFQALETDLQDLVLHLIAVHHGRGRPHFPAEEIYDPEPKGRDLLQSAAEIPRRFARLQRKYGRWGLAYLESLLRAADYAASADPSQSIDNKEILR